MTDSEKIDVLLSKMTMLQQGQQSLRDDVKDIKVRLEKLEENQRTMESDIRNIKVRLDRMEKRLKNLEKRQQNLEERQQYLEEKLQELEKDLAGIRLQMENVTNKNLRSLAESYGNLTRKLDENNIITNQQIAYQIKVDYLIDDVKKLKREAKELSDQIA